MELRELAAMVKLYRACRLAIGAAEPTIKAEAVAACTYTLQKVPGLAEFVEDEQPFRTANFQRLSDFLLSKKLTPS